MQWLRVVIASVWRRRKGRGGEREKESVCEMVVVGEDARERAASGPDRYNTRHERGNASNTMHAFSGIVGCQCREGVHVGTSGTLDGATRFRLLRSCWTYEDAFVSQAGPKMICSSREDPSVLLRNHWLQDSLSGRMLRDHSVPARVQCAVSPFEDPGHPHQGVNSPCW